MQLRLARAQEEKKRTVEFILTATAVLTEEELNLIRRYNLQNEILAQGTITVGLISKRQMPMSVTVANLINGWTQRFDDLGSMISFEKRMKSSCEQLVIYLDAARKFGGQEIIDIKLPADDEAERPRLIDG